MGGNSPRDMEFERDRARRIARREYSASLMSSTKWRVLMTALNRLPIRQMIIKYIEGDQEYNISKFDLRTPYQYVDDFHGAMPIMSIEWVEIPRIAVFPRSNNLPAERVPQDLDVIRAGIASTGKQYHIEDTKRGFRVIGHIGHCLGEPHVAQNS